ncbi:MAG: DUF512 domain-containing protein [Thermoleophilia bacterium]|nr:DUF512 domain-containing protein [Thermoleophilia bacterium]
MSDNGGPGGLVVSVSPGSPADVAGIESGDRIISLDGSELHDVIDYQFHLEPGVQAVIVERDGRRHELDLDNYEGGDPGICFDDVRFDRVRTCANRCVFCFIDQVPDGLRRPLYLKDDDFRLSFLRGNFITLGNLDGDDIDRIIAQRLSPLHVSVHATDPELRGQMMGCSTVHAARGLANLKRLGDAGIETHAQIVLCPEMNDSLALERTVKELASDYPGVKSVGNVPLAVDSHSSLRPVNVEDSLAVTDAIAAWQELFRRERGSGFAYAADEFFLRAGRPIPPAAYYDDFEHYENGIGIARSFMDEGEGLIRGLLTGHDGRTGHPAIYSRIFLLSGTLAAGIMEESCARLSSVLDLDVRVLPVKNLLFGPYVTVTGLLGGREILAAARNAGLGQADLLLLPSATLNGSGEPRFLDDLTLQELHETLDCEIIVTPR